MAKFKEIEKYLKSIYKGISEVEIEISDGEATCEECGRMFTRGEEILVITHKSGSITVRCPNMKACQKYAAGAAARDAVKKAKVQREVEKAVTLP